MPISPAPDITMEYTKFHCIVSPEHGESMVNVLSYLFGKTTNGCV